MPRLSRRSFLAASAALAVRPAAAAAAAEFDVVIVGAGAAGIAAARRIAAAGRKFVLLEAADHIGGRCITDTATFGLPYDRGAHWIHTPDLNPVTKLVPRRGIEIYPTPESQKVRIGRRYAREGELEDLLASQGRAKRAIADAARKGDLACAQALPNDLGDWRPAVEFVLGPFGCGKDLAQVSAVDFAKSAERDADAFCRQGFGTLLAALAEGLAVKLSTPATAIDLRRNVTVETPKGAIAARSAIVTVSTNVIASGGIKFTPELANRQRDAFAKLSLGSYDHIALEIADNTLGFESDDLVFEKSAGLAHSGDPCQRLRHAALPGRGRRHLRRRSLDPRRSGDDRFRRRLAGRPLRYRREEGDQALAGHALELRALDARRLFGGGTGLARSPPYPDGAGARRRVVRRRSRP